MNDNDIIKVYEGLTVSERLNLYRNRYYNDGYATERGIIANAINDILPKYDRQKAEIERLQAEMDKQYEQVEADILGNISDGGTSCHWCIEQHEAKAIKEFAEKLKNKLDIVGVHPTAEDEFIFKIDNLVEEMTGDQT